MNTQFTNTFQRDADAGQTGSLPHAVCPRWVKCSDKMPEDIEVVIMRKISNPLFVITDIEWKDEDCVKVKDEFIYFPDIEWLDENPTPPIEREAMEVKDFKIQFTDNTIIEEDTFGWIALLDKFKIVVTGLTKEIAFAEVLKSLAVLLAYQSNISSEELKTSLSALSGAVEGNGQPECAGCGRHVNHCVCP